jgi:hypothetical protein
MNKINEIREAVLEYINNVDTDFAIMIDGEWGSGKTHFWKNEIEGPINKLQQDDLRELANTLTSFKLVPNNHSFHRLNRSFPKNKKIIYISLYGLNKLEDIDNNITMKLLTPE